MIKLPKICTVIGVLLAIMASDVSATRLFVVTGTGNLSSSKVYEGISSFSTEDPSDFSLVYDDFQACIDNKWDDWYMKQTSLFYYGGNNKIMGYFPKRFVYNSGDYYYGYISWLTYEYDGKTFNRTIYEKESIPGGPGTNESAFPNMLTYNPSNGKVYGSNINFTYANGELTDYWTSICEVNPSTGERGEEVARLSKFAINSLTTDARGVIYVTDSRGNLYSLNLESGELPQILGNIGLYSNVTLWSCFDYSTGKLYLAKDYDIYEVDVNSVTAEKVCSMPIPREAPVRGIFCLEEASPSDQGVTAAPNDLKIEFKAEGSTSATLSVKAPVYYLDGKTPLKESVSIRFYADNSSKPLTEIKNVTPGAIASAEYVFPSAGQHSVTATAVNDKGESAPATVRIWAGYDNPVAPTGVMLSIDDNGNYHATWSAPVEGEHGGIINVSDLSYNVELCPQGTTFNDIKDTSVQGKITSSKYNAYYVKVRAQAAGMEGIEAVSDYVLFGDPHETAWYEDFSNPETFGTFKIIDGNHDGCTWQFKNYFDEVCIQVHGFYSSNTMDEWLICPPVRVRKGAQYKVTFDAFGGIVDSTPNKLEVYGGNSTDISSMWKLSLHSQEEVTTYPGKGKVSLEFESEEDGDFYLALHAVSNAGSTLCLRNISIESAPVMGAPAAAESLKILPAEKGKLQSTVSFKAPEKLNIGGNLAEIKEIRVLRDNNLRPVKVFENPVPGESLTFVDEVPTIGNHTYVVYAYNDKGIGAPASGCEWIGEDLAGRAQNFKLEETTTSFVATWEAPVEAQHGGYIDYDNLSYTVLLWIGNMDEPVVYASNIKDHRCEILFSEIKPYIRPSEQQTNVEVYVYPVTAAGAGNVVGSTIIYGQAYGLPFTESFKDGTLSSSPWMTINPSGDFLGAWRGFHENSSSNPDITVKSQDNDGGLIAFYQTKSDLYEERINTPRINKAGEYDPGVEFYLYHNSKIADRENCWIKIEAFVGSEYVAISEPIYLADGDGWTLHSASLSGIKADDFRLSFHGCAVNGTPLFLDNIRVASGLGAVESIENDALSEVKVIQGGISLRATDAPYSVLTLDGAVIESGNISGNITVALSPDIYIVRLGNKTAKCIVK